jgi:hypothetical protein
MNASLQANFLPCGSPDHLRRGSVDAGNAIAPAVSDGIPWPNYRGHLQPAIVEQLQTLIGHALRQF